MSTSDPSLIPPAEEREFLLRSIRDLDAEFEAGDLDEVDYRSLRDDYVARAADAIRRDEAGDEWKTVAAASAPAPASGSTGSLVRRLLVGTGVVVVAVSAGLLVASSSGERVSGEAATGSFPEASTDRIANAQRLVRDGEVLEAIKVYDDLLADDPDNPVALAEKGWLLSRVDPSLADRGLTSIEKAIVVDPEYPEAHFYRGMILLQLRDDPTAAVAAFETALASDPPPDLRGFLQTTLEQARTRAAG